MSIENQVTSNKKQVGGGLLDTGSLVLATRRSDPPYGAVKINATLWPPNPNELLITEVTSDSLASLGT